MKVKYIQRQVGYNNENLTIGKEYEIDKQGDGWFDVINDIGRLSTLYDFETDYVKPQPIDTIVESVINQFRERSEIGIKKYGVTLDRDDLSRLDWINHAQQEAMDFVLYLEKLKQTL